MEFLYKRFTVPLLFLFITWIRCWILWQWVVLTVPENRKFQTQPWRKDRNLSIEVTVDNTLHNIFIIMNFFILYDRVLTSLENLEISGNFVNLENSWNLKCTQGIFGAHYYQRQKCRPMTLVSENIRFMQIFAGVPLGGGVERHSTLCKKYAKMTATVILYIGFPLYNCL